MLHRRPSIVSERTDSPAHRNLVDAPSTAQQRAFQHDSRATSPAPLEKAAKVRSLAVPSRETQDRPFHARYTILVCQPTGTQLTEVPITGVKVAGSYRVLSTVPWGSAEQQAGLYHARECQFLSEQDYPKYIRGGYRCEVSPKPVISVSCKDATRSQQSCSGCCPYSDCGSQHFHEHKAQASRPRQPIHGSRVSRGCRASGECGPSAQNSSHAPSPQQGCGGGCAGAGAGRVVRPEGQSSVCKDAACTKQGCTGCCSGPGTGRSECQQA